jgi:hypothetical protein
VLETSLKEHLFGQHIVYDVVIHAIKSHFGDIAPKKALALSFNGFTGSGKTFVSQFIMKSLFVSGIKSKYAHFFSGRNHFAMESKADIYKVSTCIYASFTVDNLQMHVSTCIYASFTVDNLQMHVVVKT